MGIFDDVVVNAKSAAQTVGKMAGQFVDMSKLRINMAELNGEITKRYQELGRFIYEAKKAGSADEAELANQIAGIDDLYAQLSAEAVEKTEVPAEPETTEVTIETEKTAEPTEEVKTEE